MSSSEGEEDPHAHPDEGDKGLSATNTAKLKQADDQVPQQAKARRKRSAGSPDDVSRALRSAYDDALREQVPNDFMDLLGKLS